MAKELPSWVKHPGFAWTDDANCRQLLFDDDGVLDPEAAGLFFVEAGHVITDNIKTLCRRCPVRKECLLHSYTGAGGQVIVSGYFAGFSSGQRANAEFEDLYEIVVSESDQYRKENTENTADE